MKKNYQSRAILALLLAFALLLVSSCEFKPLTHQNENRLEKMNFDEFLRMINEKQVESVVVYPKDGKMTVVLKERRQEFSVDYPEDFQLSKLLIENMVNFRIDSPQL